MANNVDLVMRLLAEDKASGTFKRVGGEVDKSSAKWKKFGGIAAAAVGTAAILKFGKDSVAAYSEAQKSQAKLEAAYKKFPAVNDVNIESLRDYNGELQRKTIYDADDTAAMQARLAMFDLTGSQIQSLTPLVQDLASATGQDLGSAGEQLGKALMGNTRALKAIGINYKVTGDAAADYAAIQELVSAKVGGFAEEEGKTAAGQAAILANEYGDLQETVGEALLPALQALVDVAQPILETFNNLPKPAKNTALAVGAISVAALVAAPRIAAAKAAVAELGLTSATASGRVAKFGKVLGAAGLVLAAGQATSALTDTSRAINRGSDDLSGLLADIAATGKGSETLGYQVGSLGDEFASFNDAIMRSQLPDWADTIDGAIGSVLGFESSAQKATAAVDGVDKALAAMVSEGRIDEAAAAMNVLRDEFVASGGDVAVFDGAIDDYRAALHATLPTNKDMAAGLEDVGDEADAAEEKIKGLKDQIRLTLGVQIDAKQRAIEWKNSIAELSGVVDENGRSLNQNTEKGRANASALLDRVEAAMANAEAELESGVAYDKVRGKYAKNIDQLRDAAIKAGLNRDEVDKLIGSYKKLPEEVETDIKQNITASVVVSLRSDGSTLISGPGGTRRRAYLDTGARANGGSVRGGGAYRVGEFGPELFVPSTSGRIVPASRTAHGVAGGGDLLPVSVNIDGRQLAFAFVPVKRNMGGRLPFED